MSRRVNPPHSRRGEPVVIFRLGSQRFVIASAEVEEIRDLHQGNLPPTIAARGNGRQIPVIAADEVFGVQSARLEQLLVLKLRRVAVAIDRIEGMAELARNRGPAARISWPGALLVSRAGLGAAADYAGGECGDICRKRACAAAGSRAAAEAAKANSGT